MPDLAGWFPPSLSRLLFATSSSTLAAHAADGRGMRMVFSHVVDEGCRRAGLEMYILCGNRIGGRMRMAGGESVARIQVELVKVCREIWNRRVGRLNAREARQKVEVARESRW